MVRSDSLKARGGLLVILGVSVGLFTLHVVHALSEGENFQTFLFGILIPMALAISVFLGGLWIWRHTADGDNLLRVGGWCVVGVIVLAVGALLIISYQRAEGVNMSDQLFVVVNASSVGAVVGLIVGVYDSEQRRARAKANRLSQQLTVLNRVLRHDIRNDANVIQGRAELIADKRTDRVEQARTIQERADNLVEMGEHARKVERMLRDGDGDLDVVNITPLVDSSCQQLTRKYPDADIDISLPETERVIAHPLTESALSIVIENAVEHNDKQTPHVDITSREVLYNGSMHVEVRIADNGPGIPETERSVLKRGYETDLEHMSGLGLWLVNWIVTTSNGTVRFEENDPDGSIVCLRFKRDDSPTGRASTLSRQETGVQSV